MLDAKLLDCSELLYICSSLCFNWHLNFLHISEFANDFLESVSLFFIVQQNALLNPHPGILHNWQLKYFSWYYGAITKASWLKVKTNATAGIYMLSWGFLYIGLNMGLNNPAKLQCSDFFKWSFEQTNVQLAKPTTIRKFCIIFSKRF